MVRSWHLNVAAAILALVGLTAVFVGSAGDSWAAPTLVVNGDFETDTTGWSAEANTTITHEPSLDGDLTPPGAALVTYTGTGAGDAIASQCIDLTGAGADVDPLELTAYYREPAGQANNPQVSIDFTLFDDTACTTNPEAHPSGSLLDANNSGWSVFNGGLVLTTTKLSLKLDLVVHGTDSDDAGIFDKIALSAGALDTPTPSNTPTVTNTATVTNTPLPTNTGVPTGTPVPTDTPEPTETPEETHTLIPTDTPTATNTPVPPTSTNTPVTGPPALDDTTEFTGGAGAGGEQPEDAVGAGGEEPEGAEFPESGYGPGAYEQGGSHATDVIAAAAFSMAIAMLSAGFYLRRKVEQEL